MLESSVAKAVRSVAFARLDQLGIGHFERVHSGAFRVLGWLDTDVSKARSMRAAEAGTADYLGIVRRGSDGAGIFVAVETKVPKTGVQSPEQKDFQRMVEQCGGIYVLASDPYDTADVLFDLAGISRIRRQEPFAGSQEEIPF